MTDPKRAEILQYLQNLSHGGAYLPPREVGLVLNCSVEAVRGLIQRNNLPFKIKKIGGRWRASVFDIADFLMASDVEPNELEVVAVSLKGKEKTRSDPSSSRSTSSGHGMKLMQLRQERKERLRQMCRFVERLSVTEERQFIANVIRSLVSGEFFPSNTTCSAKIRQSYELNGVVFDTQVVISAVDLYELKSGLHDKIRQLAMVSELSFFDVSVSENGKRIACAVADSQTLDWKLLLTNRKIGNFLFDLE